ncbi:MAG: hypothetical protein A2268_01495 [Candidatus Raymondbacteria bacterium RifOxyA12_full_50_37]|uniref:Secretion system C-terminal sorting domain-containing protein n=1 Tax=Candidatus Raymondbacteria bacterium RIFOXYD12_FULL_49_13 TaxID=1817890 RepID=A0A1F7F9N1_UNCRA|nr:MAG: hypothetical protein A2268_01495 [Candidatus Raymondbacteria bacterium RifOxyA12_full_50_37]OGJ87900.1 MAG: hypothetical protein A2248_01780 [Candidatus Raymondbacteria bacterium RIFOXYA2_FULL_49_16]OGJ89188.1 MAG: hypothetical protein A2350_01800 [Candidatus Raymondbacteria bacterium RifOxyB12_full_50_8]OGJ93586.1 MAG: hypothetical protein A2487_07245 [Candidatus Raymondbacteria bacterium RifOxyC12_full_50_8]OGK03232.1 MAG: hypothetical protein A2519_13255 [Candidatus Raymondbacteria b
MKFAQSVFFPALIALLLFLCAPAPCQDSTRILFIGNSFSLRLPTTLVRSFARERGYHVYTKEIIKGGTRLEGQWADTTTLHEIRVGNYDYVVLQGYQVDYSDSKFSLYADSFNQVVTAAGAKSVFYMTWAYVTQKPRYDSTNLVWFPSRQDTISQIYMNAVTSLGALVSPVGFAFDTVIKEDLSFPLWYTDGYHQSTEGGYLGACVFFAAFFGEDPTGLTSFGTYYTGATIDSATKAYLQHMAWVTVNKPELNQYIPYKYTTKTTTCFVADKSQFQITCSPNPFNPRTCITLENYRFQITDYELGIYTISGKLVKSLTPDIRNSFVWDASNQPSGVYIIKATAGGARIAKKVLLTK